MKKLFYFILMTFLTLSCKHTSKCYNTSIRGFTDTVGFAHTQLQADSVISRIYRIFGDSIKHIEKNPQIKNAIWKVAISPHDDHAYASYLYPLLFKHIKAKHLIIFGVAHKAWKLHLKDKIVFGTFCYWKGAYGKIKIWDARSKILKNLPQNDYIINDTMIAIEHSIEAFMPFLQKYTGKDILIIPILVPYMNFETMNKISKDLAEAIHKITRKMTWGKDFAIIISTDAVHYGDQNWGGENFAYYGADTAGYRKAIKHEQEIIKTIIGKITPQKIKQFMNYTIEKNNYMKYKWTWCGRYSVPMGLLTAYYLSILPNEPLKGIKIAYATSINHKKLPVEDLGIGITAPANIHHWVGYAAIGYK